MKKLVPRIGQVFESRDDLESRLITGGWTPEGGGTSFKDGQAVGYNVGVLDLEEDLWLMVDLKPFKGKLRVSKVKKLKFSDFTGDTKKKRRRKRKKPTKARTGVGSVDRSFTKLGGQLSLATARKVLGLGKNGSSRD